MRWKIILPNLLVVLLVGLLSWLYLRSYYVGYFDERANQALQRDRNLFEAANQLRAVKFLRTVVARSRFEEVQDVFSPVTPEDLRRYRAEYGGPAQGDDGGDAEGSREELFNVVRLRAHKECQSFRMYLSDEASGGRPPEIVAITDNAGKIISRDVDPNAEVGTDLAAEYPSVRQAVSGNSIRDIWLYNNFLLDVAIAPIARDGTVVGALLVGYDISNGVALADREMFGHDVAYIFQGDGQWRVHSSSIAEGARREALVQAAGSQQEVLSQSMSDRETARFLNIDVIGEQHIGLAGALSGENSSTQAGYIMLASIQDVREPAQHTIVALFAGLLGVLLVVVVGFALGFHFLKPVEEIEEGLLRVINGDVEHRFEVKSAEFGGLAYRVNQLVAALTGEEEESEDDQGGASPMS